MTRQSIKWMVTILLFLASGSALATRWELVYEKAGYREEVDRDSVNRIGQKTVQAWDRLTPPGGAAADTEGFNYRYILTWSEYDCANRRITVKRRIYIGDNARQVKEQRPIHQPVVDVKPGTPRAVLLSAVCGISPPKSGNAAAAANPATTTTTTGRSTKPSAFAGQPQLLPNRREAELASKRGEAVKSASVQKQKTTNSAASSGKGGGGTHRYLQNLLRGGKRGEIILTTSGTGVAASKIKPSSKSK